MPTELNDEIADGLQAWILHLASQHPDMGFDGEKSPEFKAGWDSALQAVGDLIAEMKISGWATPPAATRLPHGDEDLPRSIR